MYIWYMAGAYWIIVMRRSECVSGILGLIGSMSRASMDPIGTLIIRGCERKRNIWYKLNTQEISQLCFLVNNSFPVWLQPRMLLFSVLSKIVLPGLEICTVGTIYHLFRVILPSLSGRHCLLEVKYLKCENL